MHEGCTTMPLLVESQVYASGICITGSLKCAAWIRCNQTSMSLTRMLAAESGVGIIHVKKSLAQHTYIYIEREKQTIVWWVRYTIIYVYIHCMFDLWQRRTAFLALYLQWHLLRWVFFVITRVCIGELCLILFLHLLPHLIQTRTNALAVDEEEAVPEGVHDKEGYPDPERVVPAVVCLAISQSWVLPETETHTDHWRVWDTQQQ